MAWDFEAASAIFQTHIASQGENGELVLARQRFWNLIKPGETDSEVQLLAQAASDIMNYLNQEKWCINLQEFTTVAHENMRRVISPTELTHWREVYADTCILRAITQCRNFNLFDAVSTLDHAIIISGTTSRIDIILDIIPAIQSSMEQPLGQNSQISKITKPFIQAKSTIPCISPPSFLSFQTVYSRSPFILRNFAQDWPALNNHPWRKAEYLRSIAGPGRMIPVEIGKDYRTDDWKQVIMSWDEFLSTIDFEDQPASKFSEDTLYLAQHDLTIQFPSLRRDIIIPDYVYASLSNSEYANYRPPANDDNILFNTWLGPEGTMSPAHNVCYPKYVVFLFAINALSEPLLGPLL